MKNVLKLTALLSALGVALPLHATPTATPDTWGGDYASRPRLTGDWGGVRDDMANKGVTPKRPHDNFGIGWARTVLSDDFLRELRALPLNLGLDYEDVVELYYNVAITPWLSVSPSLQIVSPALNKTFDPTSQAFKDLETTYIAGVRVGIRF